MKTNQNANQNANKPVATLRDGAIKATIWGNLSDNGRVRYSIDISRSYTDDQGAWHDTHYFGRNELLRVARLAGKAFDEIAVIDADEAAPEGGSQ